MNPPERTFFNWSTGKDSALALYYLLQDDRYEVARLVTTVNSYYNRISMHGLSRTLLERQVRAIGIPLITIELPKQPSMEEYENAMRENLQQLRSEGFSIAAFGDIFLEDLREYREKQLERVGFRACFPIWKSNTRELIRQFIEMGFRAIVVSIDAQLLDASFAGREIDSQFPDDLPPGVDPCGENGEFHAFCYDGPIFNQPVEFSLGDLIYKEYPAPNKDGEQGNNPNMGFWFRDLLAR